MRCSPINMENDTKRKMKLDIEYRYIKSTVIVIFCVFFVDSCMNNFVNNDRKQNDFCCRWEAETLNCIDSMVLFDKGNYGIKELEVFRQVVLKKCSDKDIGLNVRKSFLYFVASENIWSSSPRRTVIVETEQSGEVHYWKNYLFKVFGDSVECEEYYKSYDPWKINSRKIIRLQKLEDVLKKLKTTHECKSPDVIPSIVSTFEDELVNVSLLNFCYHFEQDFDSIFH